MRKLRRHSIVAVCLLAVCLAGAATDAQARPKPHQVHAYADPQAPAGKTPIAIITVTHARRGWTYWLSADQVKGSSQYCIDRLGSFLAKRASSSTVTWDPRPSFFKEKPWTVQEYYAMYAPCQGTYRGRLEGKSPRGRARHLRDFTVQVPSMRVRYVR